MDLNQVLIEAAKDGNMLVLKTALEKGADINATDSSEMTALMYVKQKGYVHLADFLRGKGAKEEENFAIYYYKRGKNYEAVGEHQKAIDDYTKMIELDLKDAIAYINRGSAYDELGEYQKAIDDYTKAIALDPEDAHAYNNRGFAYYKSGEYQKAIKDYTKAIALDPENDDAYHNRGFAYNERGKYRKAINNYYQAGTLYLKKKNKTKAIKCIDSMKKINSFSHLVYKLQGLIEQI